MNKQYLIKELNSLTEERDKIQSTINYIKRKILSLPSKDIYEEFENWYKYSDKIDYCCMIEYKDAPIIGDIVNGWLERYQIVYCEQLYEMILDGVIEDEEGLMKEMIKHNLGSMEYDW